MRRLLWCLGWIAVLVAVSLGWCDRVASVLGVIGGTPVGDTGLPSATPTPASTPGPPTGPSTPTPVWSGPGPLPGRPNTMQR